MNIRDRIIDYVVRNRVSTTEVADALGKSGVLSGVSPITPDLYKCGPVRCIFTAYNSNNDVHEQLRRVKEGEIVLIFAHECSGRALMGDLMARFALLYQRAEALVVNGLVRDNARLRRERYAIWAYGATPLGCFNIPAKRFPAKEAMRLRQQFEGGIAICDDGGVTVIPPDRMNAQMMERLERIELQEDLWYYCLNTLKWDTKKIVSDKSYLRQAHLLPAPFRKQLERLRRPLDS